MLLDYWPSIKEVRNCITSDAEGVHDALLLSVHQPFPITRYRYSSGERFSATEDDLFEHVLAENSLGRHMVPVTGASGVGKSHMVRVLAARLESQNADGRYVVIRIPKSASLRNVVELILEKLPGTEYEEVRSAFLNAVSEVKVSDAVVNFQGQLDIALQDLERTLKEKVNQNSSDKKQKNQLHHVQNIARFFGDPVLVEHFRTNVFPRFVSRAIDGQPQANVDDLIKDFREEDFYLPDSIKLGDAAKSTQQYYRLYLEADEGKGFKDVTALLNDSTVVDQAIGQVFGLHQALGGMTLQDIIFEIRKKLCSENRELVFFVEDFKALIGIQDTLLKVFIMDAKNNEGETYLAPIRSVIAVTDGYLSNQDTFSTRASYEWVVESHLSDDKEVLRRSRLLVASYLNASRHGFDKIKNRFNQNHSQSPFTQSKRDIASFSDSEEDSVRLSAFGYEAGIPLFPYTDLAIEQLTRVSSTRNNQLIFNPRVIIDFVLSDFLKKGRSAFESGNFPPSTLGSASLGAEVAQWLASQRFGDSEKTRFGCVIGIWGNSPSSVGEVGRIRTEVFEAFGLVAPTIDRPPENTPQLQDQPNRGAPERRPGPIAVPRGDDEEANDELKKALENWVQKGEQLVQAIANNIRGAVAEALNENIDWNAFRMEKIDVVNTEISLPNARGQGGLSDDRIEVYLGSEDGFDKTGRLRKELAAVCRQRRNARNPFYHGHEDDRVWVQCLVDRLMPHAIAMKEKQRRKRLTTALYYLRLSSSVLGVQRKGKTLFGMHDFFYTPLDELKVMPPDIENSLQEWSKLQEIAHRVRSAMIKTIGGLSGSFQGTGTSVHAIDICLLSDLEYEKFEEPKVKDLALWSETMRGDLSELKERIVKATAKNALRKAEAIYTKCQNDLGKSFDKNDVVNVFSSLAEQLSQTGTWNDNDIGVNPKEFLTLGANFRSSALHESLKAVEKRTKQNDDIELVTSTTLIGQIHFLPLICAEKFLDAAGKLFGKCQNRKETLNTQLGGVSPTKEVEGITASLGDLSTAIGEFYEAKTNVD